MKLIIIGIIVFCVIMCYALCAVPKSAEEQRLEDEEQMEYLKNRYKRSMAKH
jgi:uncharacterized membrane protein